MTQWLRKDKLGTQTLESDGPGSDFLLPGLSRVASGALLTCSEPQTSLKETVKIMSASQGVIK